MIPKGIHPVEVSWVDPAADGGWKPQAETVEAAKVSECRTTGYLLHRDKSRIVVAQSFNKREPEREDLWADTIAIPVANVKRIRRLK